MFATTFHHSFRGYMGNIWKYRKSWRWSPWAQQFFRTLRMGVEGSHTPEDPRLHMRPVEAGRKIEWATYVEELLGVNYLVMTIMNFISPRSPGQKHRFRRCDQPPEKCNEMTRPEPLQLKKTPALSSLQADVFLTPGRNSIFKGWNLFRHFSNSVASLTWKWPADDWTLSFTMLKKTRSTTIHSPKSPSTAPWAPRLCRTEMRWWTETEGATQKEAVAVDGCRFSCFRALGLWYTDKVTRTMNI